MRFNDLVLIPTNEDIQDTEVSLDETTEGTETAAEDEFDSELASDQAAVESSHDVAQRSIDIASNLDALQASAAEVVRNNEGALTPSAAMMLSASMESICGLLKIDYTPLATTETFSSTWSKRAATTQTMEGLMDTMKKAGQAVIEVIKKALEAAKRFLSGIFANRTLLEMRVKSLSGKVAKLNNGSAPKEAEITGSFAKRLSFKGKSDYSSVMQILNTSNEINGLYGLGVSFIKDIRDKKMDSDMHQEFGSFLGKTFGQPSVSIDVNGKTIEGYGAVIGSMSMGVSEENMNLFLVANGNTSELESMETPKVFEMKAALAKAISVIQGLIKAESSFNTVTDMLKGIIRTVETEYNRLRSAMGSEEHSARLAINKQAKLAQSVLSKMIARLPGLVFMSVKYVCDWVNAGIRAYPMATK